MLPVIVLTYKVIEVQEVETINCKTCVKCGDQEPNNALHSKTYYFYKLSQDQKASVQKKKQNYHKITLSTVFTTYKCFNFLSIYLLSFFLYISRRILSNKTMSSFLIIHNSFYKSLYFGLAMKTTSCLSKAC